MSFHCVHVTLHDISPTYRRLGLMDPCPKTCLDILTALNFNLSMYFTFSCIDYSDLLDSYYFI